MAEPSESEGEPTPQGLFDAGHTAFIDRLADLRPILHRYCTRMTGSALDGEDVVQDAIFEAYRKLDAFDPARPLGPWVFRIAHNRCIDFLRRRRTRRIVEAAAETPAAVAPAEAVGHGIDRAIARLVLVLPPKERACVVLKDVLDYSNEEIADLVGSTPGGVKSALNRARAKLAAQTRVAPASTPGPARDDDAELLRLYVERFNRQDWDGVRALASADARLQVADCFRGLLDQSPYFIEYERPIVPWRMALGLVDGETAIVILRVDGPEPVPFSAIRVGVADGQVVSITDYIKCAWLFDEAAVDWV